ncbi:hypothetical protein BDZ45DRAFT_669096 [Acephala macrosclerotiorum]|nr:hypothetical protein BDZ45DRAFT_669096 [Acephala macrosclerotiorum]
MPPRADLTSNIGVDMEKRAMEKVLDIRTKQLLNAEMRNMEQQNEIKALRATIDGDPTLAGDFIIPNPSRNLAVNIQIGGKLYGEIPAGMPNAGLYVSLIFFVMNVHAFLGHTHHLLENSNADRVVLGNRSRLMARSRATTERRPFWASTRSTRWATLLRIA